MLFFINYISFRWRSSTTSKNEGNITCISLHPFDDYHL